MFEAPTLADLNIGVALAPVFLALYATVLLVIDLWIPKERKETTAWLAAGGVVFAFVANAFTFNIDGEAMLGMFRADQFTAFSNLVILATTFIGILMSVDYLKRTGIERGEYYSLLLFTSVGTMWMAAANDLIAVFVALELLSIPLYVLAAFRAPELKSEESGLKYFILGAFSSAFFVYGAALVQGMLPENTFIDKAVEIPLGGGAVWRPSDLSPPSNQSMTLRQGLMYSKNTITAQVMQEAGPKRVVDLAVAMGVNQSKLDPVPALALGTSPVTMLEMATAYSTIANGGDYRQPVVVTRIADRNGRVLAEFEGMQQRALPALVAQDLVEILRAAVTQGTGAAIRSQFGIQADVAGKTGTTQNNTDGWFMLMHPGLVSGAWVGFNDARVTMRSNYWGQGAHNALYVVGDFFRQAQNGRLVDVNARFGGSSVVSPMLQRMDEWLGRDRHPLAVPPDPGPEEAAPPEPQQDELERIIEQAREAVQ